jgi:hypothetical protein
MAQILQHKEITAEISAEISEALKNNSARVLVISESTFNPEIIRSLSDGLKQNSSLAELDLLHITIPSMVETILLEDLLNSLNTPHLTLEGIQDPSTTDLNKKIFQSLKSSTTLRTLLIRNMPLVLEDIHALFSAIKDNNSIESFILSTGTQVDQKGAEILREILQTKKNITTLNLINNSITDQICQYIAEGLKNNQTLRSLDLSENQISAGGIIAICNSLKTNWSLKNLVLCDNPGFSFPALTALKDMLASNTTIRRLWISNCYQPREENEVDLICSGLKLNESLTFVDIYSSDIPDDYYTYIKFNSALENVLEVNYSLRNIQQYRNNDTIQQNLKRNQNLQAEMLHKIAILVHNIARSKEAIGGLPNELWLEIFSLVRHPGLDPVVNSVNLFHKIQSGLIVRVTGSH